MIRVLLQDCHARLHKYRQRIDQEKAKYEDEDGTKLLQQRVTELAHQLKETHDEALENEFRKLPNPTSSRNDILPQSITLSAIVTMPCRRAAAATDAEKFNTFVELLYCGRPAVSSSSCTELAALLATSTNKKLRPKSKKAGQNQAGNLLLLEANGKRLRLRKTKMKTKKTLEPGRGGRTVKRLKVAKLATCRQLDDTGVWGNNLLLFQFRPGNRSSSRLAKKPDKVLVLRFQDAQAMAQVQNLVHGVTENAEPVDTRAPAAEATGQKEKEEGVRREEAGLGSAVYIWRRGGSGQRRRFRSPVRERTMDLREVVYMKRINFAATNQEPSREYTRVSVFSEVPFDFPISLLSASASSSSSSSSSLSVPSPRSPYAKPKVVM
ncbi:unnamed protein product [Schistocephalus solidus]|uniref:Uncharacterized protein n=1 Tax=Schistocephalus solidus TaxID=70667 RepID=A0A183TAT1_SCHSO|nr:unnamed protein product [Schistocephalus solidus]